MSRVALITVLFDYPEYYQPTFYKKSLEYFKSEDVHIIRMSNLITTDSYYEKLYYYKIIKLCDYIENNILNKYDYILFMDATDTAFMKSFNGVLEKFKKLNCNILFGAEKELWPRTNYTYLYENKERLSEYCYLNSGTYIGYTDKIFHYLKDMIDKDYFRDDQGSWATIYLLNNDVKLDQNCEIFFSTHKSKNKIKIEDNLYKLIDVDAHIIHDNGGYHEDTIKLVEFFK